MLRVLRTAGRRQCTAKITWNAPGFRQSHCRLIWRRDGQQRGFADIPPVLLPPVVFGGLVMALWTWKCLMMVIFQNKIIYMPGLPPNARRERIEDYKHQCGGILWVEERTRAGDGTEISLCIGSVETGPNPVRTVYILYFQGNASSLPPRLPFLSPVLRMLRTSPSEQTPPTRYKMVCCSYRGYWTSRGRPSEKGITKDAEAALKWIKDDSKSLSAAHPSCVAVWGQSIGAGFANNLAAASSHKSDLPIITLLILETPFLSIKSMLETLYPQRWLPYRYLWPFLRNHLDSHKMLGDVAEHRRKDTRVLILDAGKDELVPRSHGDELERRCHQLGFNVKRHVVGGALHTEVMARPEGRSAVVEAVCRVGKDFP